MLDTETKRRIDTARDILVGKIPDPKSQVEQITIALIYKFMDDMDAQSVEMGGKATFFTGQFEKYGWRRVFDPRLGGFDILALYSEAITKINENPNVPQLFRDIFKNAYLPYRDPETLKLFLKTIDEFRYDHSERLGDAFEYLLSVLGSQGDAGQFRTPRHIIDFIVKIVDPQKGETILDPASGTAGFLISAYKHIVENNPKMTPDERKRLMTNVVGYDISPDMVRLGLANMYLHGFPTPEIHEYDTLTSEDRWNEYFDVILANPPFMSPTGGIQPHRRFAITATRSEVLFVDYIAEHLTTKGRAGVIVPEGIIFQSKNAYRALRKMLVEQCLVAVVSLPAGVFKPYSGVKTSILILDRQLAKQSNSVGFFKVENDGFNLGAQRRPIEQNDLPQVFADINEYFDKLRTGQPTDELQPQTGIIVPKEKLAANGDYNLSGERYREGVASASVFPVAPLGDLCELVRGVVYNKGDEVETGGVAVLRANNINEATSTLDLSDVKRIAPKEDLSDDKKLRENDIFICLASGSKNHIGKVACIGSDTDYYFGGFMGAIRAKADQVNPKYLFQQLRNYRFNNFLREQIAGANINNLSGGLLYRFEIPLPPLEVQREIVAEIEGYQKVIDGARAVIDNYRPHIPINPTWPMVELGNIVDINPESIDPKERYPGQSISYLDISGVENGTGRILEYRKIEVVDAPSRARRIIVYGDVLLSTVRPNLKAFTILKEVPDRAIASTGFAVLRANTDRIIPAFLYVAVSTDHAIEQMVSMMGKGAYPSINQDDVKVIQIPLPPLEEQERIVAEIEAEQRLIEANRELIGRMEAKIAAVLDRIWGTEEQKTEQTPETEASAAG